MNVLWTITVAKCAIAVSVQSPLIQGYMVRGALSGDRVYVSGVINPPDRMIIENALPDGGGMALIFRQNMIHIDRKASLYFPSMSDGKYPNTLHRWQISRGQFHCVPLSNGNGGDVFRMAGNINSASLRMIEQVNESLFQRLYGTFFAYNTPFREVASNGPYLGQLQWGLANEQAIDIYFDFLAPTDDRYEIYVTRPSTRNRLTRWDSIPPDEVKPDSKDGERFPRWREATHWTFDWSGGFFVASSGLDRYFVTEGGRLFKAPTDTKPGTPLKEVWKGSPVRALIHDTDGAGKFYAFTKDQFFEITDPIKPRPHTIAIIRGRTASEALEAAVKCGKLIRGLSIAAAASDDKPAVR